MMNGEYFSCQRDREIIDAGGFFCQACLVGRPAEEQSPDPRYCQGCCDFLLEEASLLHPTKHPRWIPRVQPSDGFLQAENNNHREIHTDKQKTKMLTLDENTAIVNNLEVSVSKSGRSTTYKKKELPEELIGQLRDRGMGYKAITSKLRAERGIRVSHMTIQRLLAGQRKG